MSKFNRNFVTVSHTSAGPKREKVTYLIRLMEQHSIIMPVLVQDSARCRLVRGALSRVVPGSGKHREHSRVMQVDVMQIYCIKMALIDWQTPKQPPCFQADSAPVVLLRTSQESHQVSQSK
jgi:hypothetical protein